MDILGFLFTILGLPWLVLSIKIFGISSEHTSVADVFEVKALSVFILMIFNVVATLSIGGLVFAITWLFYEYLLSETVTYILGYIVYLVIMVFVYLDHTLPFVAGRVNELSRNFHKKCVTIIQKLENM